jgi:D-inositol-3-phosphate glycosyltransferase
MIGLPSTALVVLFAGRIQPLKAPDVLLRAIAVLVDRMPELRDRLIVPVVGGPSGTGLARPEALSALAAQLGIADLVRFIPPMTQAELSRWYAAATVVAVPSYNESFGLVAIEAQACGTPVIAAAVGGLTTAVAHERSGLLVDSHEPARWADALTRVLLDDGLRAQLERGAHRHAQDFSWDATAGRTLDVYAKARSVMKDLTR